MAVTYQGLDCIADQESHEYMMLKQKLQAAVPWVDQPKYGYYTLYFGCAFIGIALLKHCYYTHRDKTINNRPVFLQPLDSFIDVLTSYCRFFGYKRISSKLCYYTSLPLSAGSAFFVLGSSLYLFLYCFVPHFWYRSCRGFGSPPLAVRAGIMATALTPFIYILSGKSNFITLVTGISYEKLNYIHQYVAVAALVLSVVHTIPFFYQALQEGGYNNLQYFFDTNFYFWSGVPPLMLLFFLCTLSKSWFRKLFYEGFLHLHWMMGVAYFATLTWHVFGQLGTDNYMWAALAFWGTQVIYRLLVKTCFKPINNKSFLRPRPAKLFKLEGSKAFQINVENNGIVWKPGQHAFLRFPTRILDNHPFSISNLPNPHQEQNHDNELKFVVVPQRGLTKQLYEEIDECLDSKVFVDGPYGGCSRDHNSFDKVVLICSGSGITATVSFLTDLCRNIRTGKNKITQDISFIWMVRKYEDIEWFKVELEQGLECVDISIQIDIYVCEDGGKDGKDGARDVKTESPKTYNPTIAKPLTNEVTSIGKTDSDEKLLPAPSANTLNIHRFKPNVKDILFPLKYQLHKRNFIVSSGSESLKLSVAEIASDLQAVVFNNDKNGRNIQEICLHTESFHW